jgi:hypothetical protein
MPDLAHCDFKSLPVVATGAMSRARPKSRNRFASCVKKALRKQWGYMWEAADALRQELIELVWRECERKWKLIGNDGRGADELIARLTPSIELEIAGVSATMCFTNVD